MIAYYYILIYFLSDKYIVGNRFEIGGVGQVDWRGTGVYEHQ